MLLGTYISEVRDNIVEESKGESVLASFAIQLISKLTRTPLLSCSLSMRPLLTATELCISDWRMDWIRLWAT